MKHITTLLSVLTVVLPFACQAKDSDDERLPNAVWDMRVPAGKVLFVGFDKGDTDMIRLAIDIPVEEATNRPAGGVDVVECLTATSELTMKISAWWPAEPEEEKSWGRFRVETEWKNDRTETNASGNVTTWFNRAGQGTGYGWRLSGFREYAEERDKDNNPQWQWCQTEKYHQMRLDKQNTGVAGVEYYRIPCAATENGTKGLVIFISESIDMLSSRICVSGKRHRFQWNRSSFSDYGAQKLQQAESTVPVKAAPSASSPVR